MANQLTAGLSAALNSDKLVRSPLKASVSLIAVCGLLASAQAFAQAAPAEDADAEGVIVVTGIKQSLANSQSIKKNSDTVVDAITAEDIGALPDRSVTEALQRVPGVAINRFAGSNDPDHFSVEGSGVVIRGLNFVRGEFNGRDAFSANGGRSLGFSDVPAELLGSVIVSKNLTAEMIEGGLAGTVNLNTRVPFDKKGFQVGITLEGNYSDLAKKWSPQVSGLVSNTWETDAGTFGLLAAASYSQIFSQSHSVQVNNFQTRTNLPGQALAYAPLGGSFRTQDYDRERMGLAAAAQWESSDRRMLATLQFIRAETSNAWGEHTFESASDLSQFNTFPKTGTNYTYDENNVFESGYITLPGGGWRSGDSNTAGARVPSGGMQQSLSRRQVYQETTNQDIGFNLKFNPDDHWAFNFDAQYTTASTDNLDVSVFGSTFADNELDLTGNLPVVIPHRPNTTRATWAAPTAMDNLSDDAYFTSRNYTFWRAAMDHAEVSDGKEWAFKGDAQYTFTEGSFLKRAKVGARWSDRDQTVRSTTYNWGRLSEIWGGNSGSAVFMDEFGSGQTDFYSFDNFFRGATPGPIGGYYFNGDLITAYEGSTDFFKQVEQYYRTGQAGAAGGGVGWRPLDERSGTIAGTRFLPSEIQDVSEVTKAGYMMLSFGNDEYAEGLKISGNVGVRFVSTKLASAGSIQFPQPSSVGNGQTYASYCIIPPPPAPPVLPLACRDGPAAFATRATFANGASTAEVANMGYDNWMPSLNLKLEVTPQLQFRFAVSRTMARPEFRYSRNFLQIGASDTLLGFRWTGSAGNPYLKPAQADQFDLSAEWYFSRVGSITVTGFYKSVKDFFYDDVTTRLMTNNGITQEVDVRGPANYSAERGKVKGFEVSYQQTYDFLPGFLSGLGFNGNYTHITSKGVPNSLLDVTNSPTFTPGNMPLEQLSKHNFNATLFYEKGPLSMRASYNWRSRFLLTARDVIFPYFPVFNAGTGQLDASIFYSITKNVKIALQGTNLLNEVLKTEQQFTAGGLYGPRSYFINDRRYTIGVRANF